MVTLAFTASALVHLIALVLYPEITVRFGVVDPTNDPNTPLVVEGLEVVNLRETAPDEREAPSAPDEELAPTTVVGAVPLVPVPTEGLAPSPPAAPDRGASAADRLRPATREEGLWMPLVADAVRLSDEEILRSIVYARLQAFNDSMAVAAARSARGTDWTYTDDDGNRWGISPGKLHLGSITIPLPFGFGASAGASDDALDAMWMDREIQRAAGLLKADATIEERAAAIRARIDAERARRATANDTTRNRGGGGR